MKSFKLSLPSGLPLLAAFFAAGCGSSGPARAPVEGTVTIAGQPLPAGRIIFTPVSPNSGPAVTARIAAGGYRATKANGPVVGKNRVEVEADLNLGFALDDEEAFAKRGAVQLPPSPIPPEFGVNSQISVEVLPGKTNKFDVVVPATAQTATYR